MEALNGFKIKEGFPVFITPENKNITLTELKNLLNKNKTALAQLLLKHGGLLFRECPIEAASFSKIIETLNLGNFVNYIGGDSPRDRVEQKVYTSTEAPPPLHIPLHQELSFIKHFPKHIYFYCEIAPEKGGQTIIADARRIYQNLSSDVKETFQLKGLTYTSRYFHKSKIMDLVNRYQRAHKSWMEVFETEQRSEVEKRCRENEFDFEWLPNEWIKIRQTRPATLEHPETRDKVWFNQAHLYDFNPKLLGWKRYLGAKLFYFRPSTRLHEIEFADGTKIPKAYLYHILDILNENTVAFPWKERDMLVLDNIIAMHGRAPFAGKRRILTALTA